MKYCTHCGKELSDDAMFCTRCGSAVHGQNYKTNTHMSANETALLNMLAQRLLVMGVIWFIIGGLQFLCGYLFREWHYTYWWFLLIVGGTNILAGTQDIQYGKALLAGQRGIIRKLKSVIPFVTDLAFCIVIGGFGFIVSAVIGAAGSICSFVLIRGYIMKNGAFFERLDTEI